MTTSRSHSLSCAKRVLYLFLLFAFSLLLVTLWSLMEFHVSADHLISLSAVESQVHLLASALPPCTKPIVNTSTPALWALNDSDPCYSFVLKFHRINECFRSYDGSACQNGIHRALPVYGWAKYAGQGFGRVLTHTGQLCQLAIYLNRPCVINWLPRDNYWTFRSFIQTGTYDARSDRIDEAYGDEILDAIRKLKSPHVGSWENETLSYRHILPMTILNKSDYEDDTWKRLWDGVSGAHKHQVLLSPNWGDSWFARELVKPSLPPQCDSEHQETLLQNALFAPTDLAQTLFEKRKKEIIGDGDYAVIHVRHFFLKRRRNTTEGLIDLVEDCLKQYPDEKTWWVLSDSHELARNASIRLPQLKHGYTDEFVARLGHSEEVSTKKYEHEKMETSILDWMTLREAKLAIVSIETEYGITGARGNGKVRQSQTCADGLMLAYKARTTS